MTENKPLLFKIRGVWFCISVIGKYGKPGKGFTLTGRFGQMGMGYTPAHAYDDWLARNLEVIK